MHIFTLSLVHVFFLRLCVYRSPIYVLCVIEVSPLMSYTRHWTMKSLTYLCPSYRLSYPRDPYTPILLKILNKRTCRRGDSTARRSNVLGGPRFGSSFILYNFLLPSLPSKLSFFFESFTYFRKYVILQYLHLFLKVSSTSCRRRWMNCIDVLSLKPSFEAII